MPHIIQCWIRWLGESIMENGAGTVSKNGDEDESSSLDIVLE